MKNIWVLTILSMGMMTSIHAQFKTHSFERNPIEIARFTSEPQLKNPNSAMLISVGATLASYVIGPALLSSESGNPLTATLAMGMLITAPSLGYLYTDNWDDFWRNSGIRLGGYGLFTIGGTIYFVSAFDGLFDDEDSSDGAEVAGAALMIAGTAIVIYSTFYDFIHVRRKVDEYNSSLVQSVQILPVVDPITGVYGAGLRVNF